MAKDDAVKTESGDIPSDWDSGSFLERVLNIAPSIIYVFNNETQSNEYANRSLGASIGYTQTEIMDMGAEFLPSVCHPDDLPSVFSHLYKISRLKDGECAEIEYRVRHKAGHWVWLLSHDAVFQRSDQGKVVRHIGLATDITNLKNAENRALSEARIADAANEELRAFAYSVSHDLKSPTNSLRLLLDEVSSGLEAGDMADALRLMELAKQTVMRMGGLLDNVLEYTSIVGRETNLGPVDLNDILASLVDELEAKAALDGVSFEIGLLPTVFGSRRKFQILFQNLIDNAMKYRRPEVPLLIRVFQSSEPDESQVALSVADNGLGIDPKDHDRIFEMFQRLHHGKDIPGNGLGLPIARRIARANDGELEVQSQAGKGSCFTIRFGAGPD